MPSNIVVQVGRPDVRTNSFRNQWMNLCLYLPQFMYVTKNNPKRNRVCGFIVPDKTIRLKGNDQPIGADQISTQFLANGNNFKTSFIHVDKADLVNMYNQVGAKHGFTSANLSIVDASKYKSVYQDNNNRDAMGILYFFRGLLHADCLRFLRDKNII